MARGLIVVACLWLAGISYIAGVSWPLLPLDIAGGDPQVRAAYDEAVQAHLLRYGLIAVVPAAALLLVGWGISRRRRAASRNTG